ncbi:hypothetical protein JD844_005111 [Phrynosoma platyrhinos]|uniref:Uncharacterized protein n=1 Tax=Phrynosoma platyrhinos TaxID=52577 RepID=A0ABQ7SE98_PHRPL|nr:hypothetical protein JD844_005111 [Phrynosoma platyrhinos]
MGHHDLCPPHFVFLVREMRMNPTSPQPKPSPFLVPQLIRGLENNIEKMRVKIMTAEKTYGLYLKMVTVLRDEVSYLPLILDDLEQRVSDYPVKLQGMKICNMDEIEAMERAKEDMLDARSARAAGRKFRETLLSLQKKQLEKIHVKDATERHRRMLARRDMTMDFPSLGGREVSKGAKLEASKAQIEYQGLVISEVEKIKSAVKCSHLWDIAGRFMAQKKSEENLQQQIEESEKKCKGLKAQLKELELEQAELKFHQNPQALRRFEMDLQFIRWRKKAHFGLVGTFVEVRNFLEKSIKDERQNLRISYEEDEDDYREVPPEGRKEAGPRWRRPSSSRLRRMEARREEEEEGAEALGGAFSRGE